MTKLAAVTGGLLAAGLAVFSLAMAPSAMAQPPANSGCGIALLALSQADKAAADATAADKAAADAKRDDDAQADADAAETAARAAALNGGATTDDLADAGSALRAEKATLEVPPVDQADKDEIVKIDAKLALIDTFIAAKTKAAAAKVVADKTDAEALRREADKTDAAALIDAAGKAGDAADKACGRDDGRVRFENCDQVRAAGKAPLRFDQPGYRVGLDRNRNGIACETVEGTVTPRAPRLPDAVDTGFAA